MPKKNTDFIESSQFGSLPPKVVAVFTITIILFVFGSSVAYKYIENWSYLDAIYFAIITISTVGYGDMRPTTTTSKIVTIAFTLTSFCGIFLLFRVIVGYVVDHQIAAIVRRIQIKKKHQEQSRRFLGFREKSNLDELADDAAEDIQKEEDADFQHGRNLRWVIHLILYLLWLIVWTLFYTLYPKEDLTVFNALYFGIITSTTIGYGGYVPISDDGKLFCCITTILGTLSLGILAGSLSEGLLAIIRGMFKKKGTGNTAEDEYHNALEKLLEAPKAGKGKLDRFDFVCEMLVSSQKCKKQEIQKLLKEFDKLDVNNDGVLDEKDFKIYKKNTLLGDNENGGDYIMEDNGGGNDENQLYVQMTNNQKHVQSTSYDEDDIGLR